MSSRVSVVNQSAQRVLVVTNPSAGARSRLEIAWELVDCLKRRGLTAEIVTDLKVIDALARRYLAEGQLRAVVAAGGDGTVAEIVNRTDPETPVAVYPLGTANLLAGYLQVERDPVAFADVLAEGCTVRLDAGRANGRIFLLMAGCGFDADVVQRLHRRRAGRNISYWTWARPIINSIRSYRYPDLRIDCESDTANGVASTTLTARWAFVVNLPCYAAGLRMAPEAVGSDGLLDVCTFSSGSLWHGLRYLGYIALRKHRELSDCKITSAARVRIESAEEVPYQLDGDPGGVLPLEIEVLPSRLTVVASRTAIESLGLKPDARQRVEAQ